MNLQIAILGTRGIPNYYGGYEQAVSFLAPGLAERGHTVTVYNSHHHPWRAKTWNGVNIVHCKDPENKIGTAGQFIYDLHCIRHARRKKYDIILMMGYTSSSVWGRLYPRKPLIIAHMDGLEWKRSKYTKPVQRFLQYAEKLAIKYSEVYIADSPVISDYLRDKYGVQSVMIPYGAQVHQQQSGMVPARFGLEPGAYSLLMARMEPENNIEMILNGFLESGAPGKMLVIGNTQNRFGGRILKKFGRKSSILFAGPIFDPAVLHSLKYYSHLYFHGHSVGGTNPSLLEAMASSALVAAHDNPFNRAVTGEDAFYFSTSRDVAALLRNTVKENNTAKIENNLRKIKERYNWSSIIDQYEDCMIRHFRLKKG